MKLKLLGLVSLLVVTAPGLVLAKSKLTPWGIMNELGLWDSEDVVRQEYERTVPHYPTRPIRSLRERVAFSQPVHHASVDIEARVPEVPVFIKRLNRTVHYDIQMRVLTPEYQEFSIVGYPPVNG